MSLSMEMFVRFCQLNLEISWFNKVLIKECFPNFKRNNNSLLS